MRLVSDRVELAKSAGLDIAIMLERYAKQIRDGERTASEAIIILADMSDIDQFALLFNYHGRAVTCLGLMDLAKLDLMAETTS